MTPENNQLTNEIYRRFNLNKDAYYLLSKEPFFAAISRRIDKIPTNLIPTAGVRVNKSTFQFEMLYNPAFFASLTEEQRLGVISHELYHLVLGHVTYRFRENAEKTVQNFAQDLAINSFIKDQLPEFCLVPGRGKFATYPPFLSAEAYYDMIMQDENIVQYVKIVKSGEPGSEQFDSHEGWGEGKDGEQSSGTAGEHEIIANERLREMLKNAVKEANSNNSWGTVSADMRKQITDWIQPKVDWRKVLRFFIHQSMKADKSSTVKRINPRYPYIHAGKKSNRVAKIAIAIDQSGSVGDDLLAMFFSELNSLASLAEFTVIPFDTTVFNEHVYVWEKGKKRTWERVLCGGTDFDAPTKWCNERTFDGLILLTDLCAPKPIPSKCQRMWMTNRSNAEHPYFETKERIIIIE